MANELNDINRAIQRSSDLREQERVKTNEERGEPALFIPMDGAEGHGVGYWVDKENGIIVAVRRMSNGYQRYPQQTFNVEFLKRLVALYEEVK